MDHHEEEAWTSRIGYLQGGSMIVQINSNSRNGKKGDRFIPNRSLMNLDQAHSLLTNPPKEVDNPKFGPAYRQMLMENIHSDSEGRPFRMLVFRGSPKSSRKPTLHIDEMRKDDTEALLSDRRKQQRPRQFPSAPTRVLDAPNILNEFYANIMDWGTNNLLAVALGSEVYLWNPETLAMLKLQHSLPPTSIAWSEDGRSLAVGDYSSNLRLWDTETSKCIKHFEGHKGRIASLSWNSNTLTSGSKDKSILNHDVRARTNPTSCLRAHNAEVCSLKWSSGGNVLASGGDDNLVYMWDSSKLSSSKFLHRLSGHSSAIKALAWCPHRFNVLASGGGMNDKCIRMWNTQSGRCITSTDTEAQICGLEWNRHHKEILSGHGYGDDGLLQNHLSLWKYPSMVKAGEVQSHEDRILSLSQSPDGLTVVSAGADETLRFWDIFGPPWPEKKLSDFESFVSLKAFPLR